MVKGKVKRKGVAETFDEPVGSGLGLVPLAVTVSELPRIERLIMQLDHVQDRLVVDEALQESTGTHGVVIFARTRLIYVDLVLESVVNEGD